ncbi:MAG TPA: hypothetical protein VFX86_03135 [Candidatus Saccharimonadales bacterium]|nr:hypothetical protein [Candidatus Saccharimonadales bacterium]
MYIEGVGEIFDRGYIENGSGKDILRYPRVDGIVDGYVMSVRKPIVDEFHDYIDGKPARSLPKSLYEVEQRVRQKTDRNGPPLAIELLLEEYAISALECPAELTELPVEIKR